MESEIDVGRSTVVDLEFVIEKKEMQRQDKDMVKVCIEVEFLHCVSIEKYKEVV